MTPNESFLLTMRDAATAAGHLFPAYAACEAALETAGTPLVGVPQSNFGRDGVYLEGNNVFGNKAPATMPAEPSGMTTFNIETREYIQGIGYMMVPATWIRFSTIANAFTYRMSLLKRWSIYAEALRAQTGEEFVRCVSAKWQVVTLAADDKMIFKFTSGTYKWVSGLWSTGPSRASTVIAIYNQHSDLLNAPPTVQTEIA